MRRIALLFLLTSACGGGGDDPGTVTPLNRAPAITSSSTASVAENVATDFYQVTATDPDSDPISFTIGGTDAARFTLSSAGQIRFATPPDFEKPADANQDNIYQVVVTASDGRLTTELNLSITVTNAADTTIATQIGGVYAAPVRAIAPVPGSKLIFVAQEDGSIRIVDPATRDLGALYLSVGGASTLLSIAPAPDYATSGRLYVTLLNAAGDLELRRYGRTDAATGDAASADLLFRLSRPVVDRGSSAPTTTGGWITFGPDGLLYLTTASDNAARGAASDNLAGKILRIDVGRDDFPGDSERDYGIPATNPFGGASSGQEIFATGFRDPREASFNGNVLVVGDQGGANRSEIDLVRPEDAGSTYGAGGVAPVLSLPPFRISQQSFVLGGAVYRGPSPQLAGLYIFYAGMTPEGIKSIPAANLVPGMTRTEADISPLQDGTVTAFGEDSTGNLYYAIGSSIFVYRTS